MTGKKFSASEKHFQEKELRLRREINRLELVVGELIHKNVEITEDNKRLLKENTIITAKYNQLLEYSKLSDEDMKQAVKRDIAVASLFGTMSALSKY